jgi:hypothetical protein
MFIRVNLVQRIFNFFSSEIGTAADLFGLSGEIRLAASHGALAA